MKVAVRYYTRSGNTKKLAEAVAEAVAAEALEVAVPLAEKVDILFLGCSYYAFDVDEAVKAFIVANKEHIGKIVCIGTSAMMKSMKKPVSKVADGAGVRVAEEEFHCRGKFGIFHKNRPNEDDLARVKEFAKKIVSE
ncbi:MAG: flavodoxin [Clostridia bacterium]|nr:flavodoxin [Clostridia bacterium]